VRKPTTLAALLLSAAALAAQTTFTESVFHSFTTADGASPQNIIQAADGNFYGIAGGGPHGAGVIYKVDSAGTGSTFFTFTGEPAANVTDGASLIQGADGNFYGSTAQGGANNCGSIFQVTTAAAYKTLYSFTCASDGEYPNGIIQGADGNFYGTAQDTSGSNFSSVFKVSLAGDFTLLLDTTHADGFLLSSPLLELPEGTFYGTAPSGGSHNYGTAFSVNSGDLLVLYDFGANDMDGHYPVTALVAGPDNLLYGSTPSGGAHGDGAIYTLSTGGAYTEIASFPFDVDGSSGVGGALLAGTDGNLYGALLEQNGSVFQVTPAGTLTTIYSLGATSVDASSPAGALIQGADGNLYGVAMNGGSQSRGAIYKLTPSTTFQPPVQLTLSANSIKLGGSVTLQWTVREAYSTTAQQCFAFTPGTTTGAGNWSGAQSSSGSATITPTAAGTYIYGYTCGGTESGFATLTVTKITSTTAVTATPNSLSVGQTITLKATVSGTGGTPTGTVTLSADGTLATVPLKSGVATLTASTNGFPPGTYPVIATYSGDANFNASASTATSVTLNKAATATALTASPTTVTPPASVTLTATATRSASGATGVPTGSVTFYADGSTALATVKLSGSGVAVITAPSKGYPANTYAITAKYLGDSADTTSTSTAVSVTVK
jgi:uncharacterized repeat protein (TIGR03803 family)